MTIDDARENFKSDVYNTLDFLPTNNEANRIIDSFDRVTSGLNQQPCEDCISRAKAIEEADNLCLETAYDNEKVIEMLNDLPSVTPKEKTGKWIDSKDWIERHYDFINFRKHCSLCNGIGNIQDKFCPNCGARMVNE